VRYIRNSKEHCATQGIEPKYVPVEKLNRVTRGNHQGAVAYLSPIDFHDLEEVIMKVIEEGRKPLILALDRITDVRNFGAIARTGRLFWCRCHCHS
jgi:23S rRNA (guanosine2251-2'-O)-methyltransferase